MLQLSIFHDLLLPTFYELRHLFSIVSRSSLFDILLLPTTSMSPYPSLFFYSYQNLNLHLDFHFLCKKGKEGRKDTLPKHVVTQEWKFPLHKIFLYYQHHLSVSAESKFLCQIAVIFDDVSVCNLHHLKIVTTIKIYLNHVTSRISISCNR